MNIVQITSHLNAGGVASYVCTLSQEFKRRGNRVLVISGGGQWVEKLSHQGIEHWQLPINTSAEFSWGVWKAKQAIAQRLKSESMDVLHAHTRVGQVVAASVSRACSISYVATWHGFFRSNLGRRFWPCTGDRTIAISEPVKSHLMRDFQVPENKIRLIAHGIDCAFFEQPVDAAQQLQLKNHLNIPAQAKIIGTVARLVASKGVDRLISAFAELAKQAADAHLLVVGAGEVRELLEKLAEIQGVGDKVHFTGALSATRTALSLMDVFVFLPADKEGFGLSLLEAMAAARPIVAVRRGGGSTWVLDQSKAGVVVEANDPAALTAALLRYLKDKPLAQAEGLRAQAIAKAKYSIGPMIDATLAVYREVVH